MIVFIDNFDSFTFNLVQAFRLLEKEVKVFRNHAITADECLKINPSLLVIGPGPKSPLQAGRSKELIETLSGKIPIFGICLGHQAIGEVFGAKIIQAPKIVHGKVSIIKHFNTGIFLGLDQDLKMARYNSLVIDPNSLPDSLEITALSVGDHQIMGIKHKTLAIEGIQFHPESILSEGGLRLLKKASS